MMAFLAATLGLGASAGIKADDQPPAEVPSSILHRPKVRNRRKQWSYSGPNKRKRDRKRKLERLARRIRRLHDAS